MQIDQLSQKKRTAIPPKEQPKKVEIGKLVVFTSKRFPEKVCIGRECYCGKKEISRIILTDDRTFSVPVTVATIDNSLSEALSVNKKKFLRTILAEGKTVSTGLSEIALFGHGPVDQNGMFDLLNVRADAVA
jgi:hypothetical protein